MAATRFVQIEVRDGELTDLRRRISTFPGAWPTIASRAANKAAASVRADGVRKVSSESGLKPSVVRSQVALRKATRSSGQAVIAIRPRRVSVLRLGGRETRRGVSYRVGGRRIMLPGAWVATVKSGKKLAFYRRRQVHPNMPSRRGPRGSELPIWSQKHVPFEPDQLAAVAQAEGAVRLQQEMVRQVDVFLAKKSGL